MSDWFNWEKYGRKKFKRFEGLWPFIISHEAISALGYCFVESEAETTARSAIIRDFIDQNFELCSVIADSGLSPVFLASLISNRRPAIRCAVTLNRNCNQSHLLELLKDRCDEVAIFAARSPKVGMICAIPPECVLNRKAAHELAGNRRAKPEILDTLHTRYSSSPEVQSALARNPSTPTELIDRLSFNYHHAVHQDLLGNAALKPDVLERLALSSWIYTRQRVAAYKKISDDLLARLCMDPDVMVRAVASNRLRKVLGRVRLSEWTRMNIGVNSSRVNTMVAKAVESHLSMGWLVVLAEFLKRVYGGNTPEFLNMLERLNNKTCVTNVPKGTEKLVYGRLLEIPVQLLPRDSIVSIFTTKWTKREINLWNEIDTDENQPLYSNLRSVLRNNKKLLKLKTLKDVLEICKFHLAQERRKCSDLTKLTKRLAPSLEPLRQLKFSAPLEGYSVRFPETARDLVDWGHTLKNCLRDEYASVSHIVEPGAILALIAPSERNPKYLIEVDNDGNVVQVKGSRNSDVPSEINSTIESAIVAALKVAPSAGNTNE